MRDAARLACALSVALVAACGRGDDAGASRGPRRPLPPAPPMPAPLVRQIGEGKTWLLRRPVVYRSGTGDSLVVPAGFVAEFAGVPVWLHRFLAPQEAFAAPAVVHDYLYWTRHCTRAEADAIFRRAMAEQQVADSVARHLGESASSWGGAAWRAYERDRARGLPRFVPPAARPDGSLETWPQYRAYLRDSATGREPRVIATPGLCALGRD